MYTQNGVLTCLGHSYLFIVSQVQGNMGDKRKPFGGAFISRYVLKTENKQWQEVLYVQ